VVSARAVVLMKGALRTMLLKKWLGIGAAALAVALVVGVAGAVGRGLAGVASPRAGRAAAAARDKPADRAKEEKAKPDKDLIQGDWTVERLESEGKDVSDEAGEPKELKGSTWAFADGKGTAKAGDHSLTFTFTLEPTAKPKQIDLVIEDSSSEGAKGKTIRALYALDGDTLKICAPIKIDGDRPTELETKEGGQTFLMVLKRGKK
jgi:uncharacterized protein (TIGR03067 family)